MSLLTLTTLLSSFLIYNSKKVPQKVDLDKIRCFSQLSTSLLAQCEKSMSTKVEKAFFPQFLWLLRDVALKMTDREGKEIGPNQFLHTRILANESGDLTTFGKSLVDLFPSLECATLAIPSIKRDIIRDILDQQHKLKPAFNTAVDTLVQHILSKLTPKNGMDGKTQLNGKALAALADSYVEAVNRPGAVPDLDQGWQAVVRLELNEVSHGLAREYEREMEEAVKGNLPMEEGNLLRIHRQILKMKKSVLREEIRTIDPLHSSDEDVQPLLDKLEHDTVQWSQDNTKKVTGGLLYQFTTRNHQLSKEMCQKLFLHLVKRFGVHEKVNRAVSKSEPLDIDREVSEIRDGYNRLAVGPAASEVVEVGLSDLSQLSDILKLIPGKPQNVEIIGKGTDRVKLRWDPPVHNPEAVEEYVVYKRMKGEGHDWEEAVRTNKTSALVKGLKSGFEHIHYDYVVAPDRMTSNVTYEFQVVATNSTITSLDISTTHYTEPSAAKMTAFGLALGAASSLCLPYLLGRALLGNRYTETYLARSEEKLLIGLSIAALPVSIALAPITAPGLAVAGAVFGGCTVVGDIGDLTEEK